MYGEENDTIQNNKGQDVTIQVGETVEETLQCLTKALGDDLDSAKSLAEAAHKEFESKDLNVDCYPAEEENLDLEKIGIWIDPIGNSYIIIMFMLHYVILYRVTEIMSLSLVDFCNKKCYHSQRVGRRWTIIIV